MTLVYENSTGTHHVRKYATAVDGIVRVAADAADARGRGSEYFEVEGYDRSVMLAKLVAVRNDWRRDENARDDAARAESALRRVPAEIPSLAAARTVLDIFRRYA